MGSEALKTGFDAEDLTIRNRVLAYKAALDATSGQSPARDELLMQFSREIADLTAQLTQVERNFGPNDPMAEVLREALGSARSRRDTRRIEMGLEPEKEEKEGKAKPALTAFPAQQQPVAADDGLMPWAVLVMLAWDQSQKRQRDAQRLLSQNALAYKTV